MASDKDIEAARKRCGNCKGGGHHTPRFRAGELVRLVNNDERGQIVEIEAETFPHYFKVKGKINEYCETCFAKISRTKKRE